MDAVTLRPVRAEDLDELYAQQADPASSALAAVASRDRPAFDAHWARLLADDRLVLRSVVVDGEVVGSAMCFGEPGDRRIGYWVAQQHWGRGIATAALRLLLEEVTERPVYATVAAHNPVSARVLERRGFVRVGTQTQDDGVVLHRYALEDQPEQEREPGRGHAGDEHQVQRAGAVRQRRCRVVEPEAGGSRRADAQGGRDDGQSDGEEDVPPVPGAERRGGPRHPRCGTGGAAPAVIRPAGPRPAR